MNAFVGIRGFLAPLLSAGLLGLAGCSHGPTKVPVEGTVTVQGQPLDAAILNFYPDESKGNTARVACMGRAQAGHYTLSTSGVDRYDSGPGAPPGWYKVFVTTSLPGVPPSKTKVNIDPKYSAAETSPLAVEVVASAAPGAYDLDLKK